MIDFFCAEDFKSVWSEGEHAKVANEKLEKSLVEKIYKSHLPGWSLNPSEFDTHEAWIFNTQEIKPVKCEQHIPVIKSRQVACLDGPAIASLLGASIVCVKCGKELKPKWEE